MRGGTVALATSPFDVSLQGRLSARRYESGLDKWLAAQGIELEDTMILDEQNTPFPVPVERQVGMFKVRETHLINYPYFLDIRPEHGKDAPPLLGGIEQLTINWASPISLDTGNKGKRKVTELLHSSKNSWTSDSLDVQPDFEQYGTLGFKPGSDMGAKLVGVMVEGRFNSWFKDKPSPLLTQENKSKKEGKERKNQENTEEKKKDLVVGRVIEHSPESARLVVFPSNTFLTDTSMGILSSVMNTAYDAPARLINNVVDWSLEDRELLSIRGRGQFARTLAPLTREQRVFWEYLNYGLALAGLFLVWLLHRMVVRRSRARYEQILSTGRTDA